MPGRYNITCKDSRANGWHGGYIEVDGIKYCESFTSGDEETNEIIVKDDGKYFSIFLDRSYGFLKIFYFV